MHLFAMSLGDGNQADIQIVSASGRPEMLQHFAIGEPDLDLRLGQKKGFDLLLVSG